MLKRIGGQPLLITGLILSLLLILSACNLGASPPQGELTITSEVSTPVGNATLTPLVSGGVTVFPTLTPIPFTTRQVVFVPTNPPPPTSVPAPISIVIISPLPGNVVAGTVQVVGSASHPQFLQYRLEYGQQPNPNNQWFSITGIVQNRVLGGPLGFWSTHSIADGLYQLRLRVFLQDGTQQTTQVGNIRVQNGQPTPIPTFTTVPRPIASFTQDVTEGSAPLVVRFTNRSQGQISSISWSFGDGGSSSLNNPTYTYRTPGIYTVALTVMGPGGSSNVSRQITVTSADAPIAAFAPSISSGEAPLNVIFTNISTGQITSYEWDFGDDSTSTEINPTHIFNDVGTFNIILRVTGAGGSSTMVRQVTVENPAVPAPIADFAPSIAPIETGQAITFNNTTIGDATNYLWDFNGDGVTDNTDISPTHVYNEAGVYDVRLIAIGPGGQSTAVRQILAIAPPDAPIAGFSVSSDVGIAPISVQFTNTTTGDVSRYEWDFNGDGVTDSTEISPSFAYQDAGTYVAVLTADGSGGSTTASHTISVETPLQAPTAGFIADPEAGQIPLTVNFTNQSDGSQLTYAWDFDGDGAIDNNEISPSHTFDVQGIYNVSLMVTDPQNQSSTATVTINVSEAVVILPPTAAFTFDPTTGTAPLTVTFVNQSSGDISGYEWDFNGDNLPDSNEINPIFAFQTAGTYTVTLTTLGSGGSNSVSQSIIVDAPLVAPIANFNASPSTGFAPLTVVFADASQGQVDSWSWDFNGDGVEDALGSGPHQFAYDVGTYNATLTLSNAAGSNSFTVPIMAEQQLTAPIASFVAEPSSALTMTFTDSSQGQIDGWSWDFNGDGLEDAIGAGPHQFAYDFGTYNATLTVSNGAGSNSFSVPIVIEQGLVPPIASFVADPSTGTAPLTVTFTDASQGQVHTWSWYFNDDGAVEITGIGPHTFTFDAQGTYNATLTVSNGAGSNSISTQIIVNQGLVAPMANFVADPSTGTAPLTVNFTDSSQGQVDSWSWDFNDDGVEDALGSGPHQFAYDAGTYNATLTVSNTAGSNSISTQIIVSQGLTAPTASFASDVSTGTAPLTVNFTDSSQGQVDAWSWDFNGDGVEDALGAGPHQFAYDAGTFNASLTVSNTAGSNSISTQIIVNQGLVAPIASFVADPSTGTAPLTVTFTDSSQGQVDSWSWDFNGDGTPDSTEVSPTFTYQNAGTYNATLTVSNTAGSNSSTVQIIANQGLVAPIASFVADPSTGTAPLTVTFTDSSQGQVDSWSWDFNGDGTPDSTEISPTFTYQNAGTYNASLTVSNTTGSNSISTQIIVDAVVVPPPPSITGNIAYISDRDGNNEIYVVNEDGSNLVNVTNDGNNDTQASWSPDGTHLAFVSNRFGDDDIFILTINDWTLTQVTTDGANDNQPVWSPDGTQLAFVSNRLGNTTDIFVVNVSDLSVNPFVPSALIVSNDFNEHSPSWSADGSQIVFVSNDTGNDELYIVNVSDAGNRTLLVTGLTASAVQPSWSSNNVIVFVSNPDGDNNIYSINPDGSGLTQLTTATSDDNSPIWSPDANRILYTSNLAVDGSGNIADNNIYFMNADGTGQTAFTDNPASDITAAQR